MYTVKLLRLLLLQMTGKKTYYDNNILFVYTVYICILKNYP